VHISQNNRKPILEFLLHRWQLLTSLSAAEIVWYAEKTCDPKDGDLIQLIPIVISAQPTKQIMIIKRHIISILPEARFIDYNYETPCELIPKDFIELYANEQTQCISKVRELIKKLKVQ